MTRIHTYLHIPPPPPQCMCDHVWRLEADVAVFFNFSPPHFLSQGLSWTWSFPIELHRLASKPQGPSCLSFPQRCAQLSHMCLPQNSGLTLAVSIYQLSISPAALYTHNLFSKSKIKANVCPFTSTLAKARWELHCQVCGTVKPKYPRGTGTKSLLVLDVYSKACPEQQLMRWYLRTSYRENSGASTGGSAVSEVNPNPALSAEWRQNEAMFIQQC